MNSNPHAGAVAPPEPGDFEIDDWDDDSYAIAAQSRAGKLATKAARAGAAPAPGEQSSPCALGPLSDGPPDNPEAASSEPGMASCPTPAGAAENRGKRPWRTARKAFSLPAAAPASGPTPRRLAKLAGQSPEFAHRSALFPAIAPRSGAAAGATRDVAAPSSAAIRAAGPELSVWDKDAWLAAVAAGFESGVGLGQPFPATLSSLAKRAGLSSSGSSLKRIDASLDRLAQHRVEISWDRLEAAGFLLRRPARGFLALDAGLMKPAVELGKLFDVSRGGASIPRDALGRWLLDYLRTHKKPYPMSLVTLRALCGSSTRAEDFPNALERALGRLVGPGLPLTSFSIEKGARSSDGWTLAYELSSAPKYTASRKTRGGGTQEAPPDAAAGEAPPTPGAPKKPWRGKKKAAPARRSGGVAL